MLEKEMKMSGSNAGAFPRAGLERNYTQNRTAESLVRATAGGRNLFADTIIDESASERGKRAASAGLALTIQAAILGALVLVPLLFTEGIDLDKLDNTVLLVPPPPAAPPAIHVQSIPRAWLLAATLTAPTVIPKKIAMSTADAGASAPAISDMPGGVPGGLGDVLGGSLNGAPPPPPLAPAARPKEVRIFSGMKEPALIYAPPVVYPPVARMARLSGTVVIEAIIDDKGNVTQVKAISGPALLMNAAL
jgi:protein TonB